MAPDLPYDCRRPHGPSSFRVVEMKRLISVLLFLGFTGASLAAAPEPVLRKTDSIEGVSEYRLPNGLRVLVLPDPGIETITVHITYLVGSLHEGYGEKGMAHL